MALYAFDGTWNEAKTSEDPKKSTNTNVFRFFNAYRKRPTLPGAEDFYVPGVGTRFDLVGKIFGGFFGFGELPRIEEGYQRLCRNWAAGDRVIDVVGFSRGAATTLDFCHHVQEKGIRRPGSDEVVEPNPQIRFLGVWDVVASFGLANLGNTELNLGHHLVLPQSSLKYCFHAMALDERRPSFLPTRLRGACEVWFRGVHSDIGGGNTNLGLNDIALKWMMEKAHAAELPITPADIALLAPKPATPPHFDLKLPLKVRDIDALDRRHYTVSAVDGCTNPPDTCVVETPEDEQKAVEIGTVTAFVPSPDDRRRIIILWDTAEATAKQLEFSIDAVKEDLVMLFRARVALITNDAELQNARMSVVRWVQEMITLAQRQSFHVMNEFFLNQALFNLSPLRPFSQ